MDPAELFGTNLKLVDRVVAGVCRRSGLRDADAEDFASEARLASFLARLDDEDD